MADLTDQQKTEIVLAHARFMSPSDIVVMLREEHDVESDTAQVVRYNPTKACYEGGERWRPIFEEARKAFLHEIAAVPVAHQAYRLNLLQEGIDGARKAKNWALVASLAEQAAREIGGIYTNQRNLRVEDNARPRAIDMTPEDRRAAVAEIFRQAMEKRAEQGLSIEKSSGVQQSARGLTVAACAQ